MAKRGRNLGKEYKAQVGKNIRKYRQLRKYSQEDLAQHMGVTSGTVANWEKGKNHITAYDAHKMSKVLLVPVEEILPTDLSIVV